MSNSQGFIIKSFDCLRNIQISKELHSTEKRNPSIVPKKQNVLEGKKILKNCTSR